MLEIDQMKQLRKLLLECHGLLKTYGEDFWANEIEEIVGQENLERMPNSIRGLFGGMGSFNDLRILEINGHRIKPSEEKIANRRLDTFRERIFEETMKLSRM